jgi:hypothetical protein
MTWKTGFWKTGFWKTGFRLALMLAGIAALPLSVSAQQPQPDQLFEPPPGASPPSQTVPPPAGAPKAAKSKAATNAASLQAGAPKDAKPKAAPADSLVGSWTGPVTQVAHDKGFTIVVTIRPGGGDTEYPELACSGKLTRAAGSGSYVFYTEKITRGRHADGGRCPDGTVTIARAGDKLAFSWFATVEGIPVFAYATLSKK